VMSETTNVMLVGVGGQGTILASRVLAQLLLDAGFDVKMSEVHGMAQRGGSVTTHVRFGPRVDAPTISPGQAHFIVAFECMEAARYAHYLREDGVVVANTRRIPSLPILIGREAYPGDIPGRLAARGIDARWLDASAMATSLGNVRVENTVLLGAFSSLVAFPEDDWRQALGAVIPAEHIELNLAAFAAGRRLTQQ